MKKSDLKQNMIVECRNGEKYIALMVNDKLVFVRDDGFNSLSNYTNDLRIIGYGDCAEYDIMKIYEPTQNGHLCFNNWKNAPIIWEREKLITLTKEQYTQLSLFKGSGYWIVKDRLNECWVFKYKPIKYNNGWYWRQNYEENANHEAYVKVNNDFSFLSWTDEEPINIDELLENCEVLENETN